ncbi:MAG: hypothetical protein AAAB35_07190 [Phyllobacterium sp.]|uniref:hypothetical protein n=1 Tax=Phyllobacterium sp. TaxID=1871046 RepID=UPI0030F0929C
MIARPRRVLNDPKRSEDCELAIQLRLMELLSDAFDAGWGKLEVLAAMNRIADRAALKLDAKVQFDVVSYLQRFSKKS